MTAMTIATARQNDHIGNDIMPTQFHRMWHQTRAIKPEHALAFAVLSQAIDDLHKYRFASSRRQQNLYRQAWEWVACDDRAWPYSFASLCDGLGFDVEATRYRLLDINDVDPPREYVEAA